MSKINHSVYYHGNLQSLGVITEENEGKSVTVVNPGMYKLRGENSHDVMITVISGEMKINGEEYEPYQKIEIKKGVEIILEVKTVSLFLKETKGYRQ